ncbi:hypothetical protein Tco_0615793 [Tanacetum coccineum]
MFGVNDLDGDEVVVKSEVTDKAGEKRNIVEEAVAMTDAVTISVSDATITNVKLTLAQTLAELKSSRPKTKGVVMQEPSESTLTISLQLTSQAQKQQELTIEEKSTLFVQLLEKRKKHFAAKRAEEKRNMPPTRAQQRSIMVNTFVDMDTDLVEGSEQKMDDDQEAAKMKELIKVIPDEEEVIVDDIHLATKPLSIVDWKIVKEGKINYY